MTTGRADTAAEQESVGDRIRRLRTERGLTQRELAEPQCSRAFLAAVEGGVRNPGDRLLAHVAQRLGMDLDDLRHGRPPGAAAGMTESLQEARRALSQGKIAHAEDVFDRVRTDATRYALPDLACWAGYWLGEARLQGGDLRAAQDEFDRARSGQPPGSAAVRAAAVARWANCQLAGGDSSGAVAALEEELRAQRESAVPDPDAQLRLYSALIYAFLELDWRVRARRLEADARALLPRVTRPEWRAQFYTTIGQLRRTPAELPEAQRLFTDAVRIYRELGLTREIGLCHWAHGYVLRRVGRLAQAADEFTAACELLLAVGALQDHAGATLELAEVRRQQGKLDEAARLAGDAARLCMEFRHLECMAEADRLLGLIAAARADRLDAERLLHRAADRYQQIGLMAEVATTCRMLGEVLVAAQRAEDAAVVFRRGLHAAERIR